MSCSPYVNEDWMEGTDVECRYVYSVKFRCLKSSEGFRRLISEIWKELRPLRLVHDRQSAVL